MKCQENHENFSVLTYTQTVVISKIAEKFCHERHIEVTPFSIVFALTQLGAIGKNSAENLIHQYNHR